MNPSRFPPASVRVHAWVGLALLSIAVACEPSSAPSEGGAAASADAKAPPTGLTVASCLGSSGIDSDGDSRCDDADTCPSIFNPDQVDLDLDGLGDPCDLAPNDADATNATLSLTDTAMVVDPALRTVVTTPDGGATLEFAAGAVPTTATITLVLAEDEYSAEARGGDGGSLTLGAYRLFVGGQAYYAFQGGHQAELTLGMSADLESVSRSFRDGSLAMWILEDTTGDGLEDDVTGLEPCPGATTPTEAQCSSTSLADDDGDGTADRVLVTGALDMVCCGEGVDLDLDGYGVADGDCNDNDAQVYPGATEVCDLVDNDCDGTVDDVASGDGLLWYADGDSDGYGSSTQTTTSCTAPSGYVSGGGDCNDADASYHPGAVEACAGRDNDCDGNANEGLACFEVSQMDVGKFGE